MSDKKRYKAKPEKVERMKRFYTTVTGNHEIKLTIANEKLENTK